MASISVAMLIVAACGSPGPADLQSEDVNSGELMALALTELVTEDHTFGEGPPPFTEYLIEVNTVPISMPSSPDQPDSVEKSSDSTRLLTEEERTAIEAAISEYGTVRWIEDPDEWRTDELQPVNDGKAILGVDAPILDDQGALVPVSLWCGGLCGTWFTYRLEQIEGVWEVTGIEGPMAIS